MYRMWRIYHMRHVPGTLIGEEWGREMVAEHDQDSDAAISFSELPPRPLSPPAPHSSPAMARSNARARIGPCAAKV